MSKIKLNFHERDFSASPTIEVGEAIELGKLLAKHKNLPIIPEKNEPGAFTVFVVAAEATCVLVTGKSLKDFVDYKEGGELTLDTQEIVDLINKDVNVPLVSEDQEGILLTLLIEAIKEKLKKKTVA